VAFFSTKFNPFQTDFIFMVLNSSDAPYLAIVGGAGHVGLPLALAFASHGKRVLIYDISQAALDKIQQGEMPFLEEGADALLKEALEKNLLSFSADAADLVRADNIIVTIGTPLDEFLNPKVFSFDESIDSILDNCRDGQLLVLRSTVYPTVTSRLAANIAARGLDIDLANCPERIAQGYAIKELSSLPQLIGGVSQRATERAIELFGVLGAETVVLRPIEAELAKLFANSYRYLNFAIANQFYMIADRFEADYYKIHQAVTKDYPRLSGLAGAGFAAGPCLLKDTMQLAGFNHNSFPLGHAAMIINEGFPNHLVARAKAHYPLKSMTTAVLGMAFKGNNDDPRDSLSYKLRKLLILESSKVLCTDPYINDPEFVTLEEALKADIVFVGACHREYQSLEITKPLIDPFHFIKSAK
jgi:UDP-N-acetyl-D-mannosaminuronic acid dehydrogenase